MRTVMIALLLLMGSSAAAYGQSFEIHGAGGLTTHDSGTSFAVGGRYSPRPWLSIGLGFERTHLRSRTTFDERGRITSSFRGGTMSLGTAEVRFMPFGPSRIGPYGLAGLATGTSRPTVNASFPNRVSSSMDAVFGGGGLQVPLGSWIAVFADIRLVVGVEGNDDVVALSPVRAGVAWRF